METPRAAHPTDELLKAFGLGKLDDSSSGALMVHLDLCADCRHIVASQSGDDFLDRLRQAHGRSGTPAPAKSLGGIEGKPIPPPGPAALLNLPPELADHPQYEILRELGRGGMGVVYLAKNKSMDRLEVLKVINKALLDRPGAVERFLREIRAAAKLNHVNVVAAYSVPHMGDLLAFAMEYVEGQDLASVVKAQGPLPISHACFYIQQAATGLQHAFDKHMIHRDIKPQNLILAREGRKHIVKVLDFGLAKATREKHDDASLTGEGRMLGTPDYIAPEQSLDAAKADIRADVYSLGCTLYFLLSGRPPFHADSLGAILLAHQLQEAKPLTELRAEVPEELAVVVCKMMAKSPAQRYQTPLEVVQALTAFVKPGKSPKAALEQAAATPAIKPPLPESPSAAAWDALTDSVLAASPSGPSGASTAAQSASRTGWLISGGLAASLLLLGLLGYWFAAFLLRVETPHGTLLVEMNDDEVEARIKNGKLILSGPDGKVRYTLTPKDRSKKLEAGVYQIRVEGADGLVLDTPEFTMKKGGEVTVRVTMVPKDLAKNTPVSLDPDRKAAEYVLSIGGIVRVNDEERDIRGVANLPSAKFRLTRVFLCQNPKVTDAGLDSFRGCNHLKVLNLHESRVTNRGLAPFKDCDCRNLTVLDLTAIPVDDVGLAPFKDCKKVEELHLNYTKVTDAGLAYFSGCKNLRLISLFAVPVTGEFLTRFADCSKLTHLDLDHTRFNDAGLSFLQNSKALVEIRLLGTQVTDKGMAYLAGCANLRELYLAETKVSDVGLAHFKDCKRLAHLRLHATRMSDTGLAYFKGCKDLAVLEYRGSQVTPAGVDDFHKALPKCRLDWPASLLALESLRRDQVPPEVLALAGNGDPKRAPASLVGVLGEVQPFHTEAVWGLAYSPDGRWLASGSADKTIMLRDAATNEVKRILKGHSGAVSAVAFSKDGKTLISSSHDGTIKLWSVEKETEPKTLPSELGQILTMAASPDGRFLAAGGTDRPIKLWKWGQWDKPLDLPALKGKVNSLSFSPDGALLASSWEARVRLYQTSDGKPTQTWPFDKDNYRVAFHRDGKWLVTNGEGMKLWDVGSGKQLGKDPGEATWTHLAALHPNGKLVYVCWAGGEFAYTRELPSFKYNSAKYFRAPHGICSAVYSPDGRFLAFGINNGGVQVWDFSKGEKHLPKQGHSHYVTTLAVSPDGRTVLSGGDDNAVRRWDVVRPGENKVMGPIEFNLHHVAFSPDGKKYVTSDSSGGATGSIRIVWDAVTGKQLFAIVSPKVYSHYVVFSPDGKTLAACGQGGTECIVLWDADSGKQLHRFPKTGVCLDSPAFSRDGKRVAAATTDTKCVKVWNVASGEEAASWTDAKPMCAVTLSPDGRLLAAGHHDGAISLWDVAEKGRKKRIWEGHSALITHLRFTPDGKTLVSSSGDGTIRLWNPEAARARETISLGPANRPLTFDLDPSGKYLFAAGHAPVIFILRLP